MKISIIIPVYNVEGYLAECLNSVVNQTYRNIEIIIVNDGSTDNSFSIIQQYQLQDERIKIINQENQGLSAARNAGIKKVSGEYIWFVDSDDYIAIDACEKIVEKLKQNNYDLLVVGRFRFGKDYKECDKISWGVDEIKFGEKYLLEAVSHGIFTASACNKIVRTTLLEQHNIYFERGILYEDLYFTFKCLLHSEYIAMLEQPFYFYRQNRNESIITTIKERDKDVLRTVVLIEDYATLIAPKLINEYHFKVLIYSWVANAVCFKYPQKQPCNKNANKIVQDIIRDKRYNKYVRYFAYSKNIEFKWKLSAWLSLNCYPLFILFIYSYFNLKRIFK